MRTVEIRTIPPAHQTYDTIGDWWLDGDMLHVVTSELGDWRMSLACGLHEVVEAALCAHDGVSDAEVTAFDLAYEKARQANVAAPCGCIPTDDSEPGEDVHAPYRRQHAVADAIERTFAAAIGVVWSNYHQRSLAASAAWRRDEA